MKKALCVKSVGRDVGSLPVNVLSMDLCMALQKESHLSIAARLFRLAGPAIHSPSLCRCPRGFSNDRGPARGSWSRPKHFHRLLADIHVMNTLYIDGIGASSVSFDHKAPIIWRLPF